jgi:hypothetical protein
MPAARQCNLSGLPQSAREEIRGQISHQVKMLRDLVNAEERGCSDSEQASVEPSTLPMRRV